MAYQQPDPFWDFIRSFDPNSQTGPNANPNANANTDNYPPEFVRGFPLFGNFGHPGHGPASPPPHHGPRGHPGRSRRHGPPPHAWAGPFGWGDWTSAGPGGAPWFQQQQHEQQQEQQRQQQQQQEQRATQEQQQQQQQTTAPPAPTVEAVPESEKSTSPDTMMGDSDAPDPAEVTPDEDSQSENTPPPYARGHCRRSRRNCNREGARAAHNHQQRQEQGPFPFDLTSLLSNLSTHPFVQNLQAQAAGAAPTSNSNSSSNFTPPLDLFSTPDAYILHLSLPGALKPDVGVDWDPETKTLRVAGVVHRPGDEEFQAMLVSGERRVGVFEREVRLPPKGGKTDTSREEEIDADGITAKMENGVLIVTVPKVEKEWTEIRKVDIE